MTVLAWILCGGAVCLALIDATLQNLNRKDK